MTRKQKAKELIYNLGKENALYLSREMQLVLHQIFQLTWNNEVEGALREWEGVHKKINEINKEWTE